MTNELPEHLRPTAALLTKSFVCHPEDAPAIPKALVQDLATPAVTAAPQKVVAQLGLLKRAVGFLSTPGFGLAAAAILLLGLFSPKLVPLGSQNADETFRGRGHIVHTESTAKIVIITEDTQLRNQLKASGLFDMECVVETSDPLVAASTQGAKLLIDTKGGAIVGYDANSREVLADRLPEDPELIPERIALAFGALQ